MLPTGPLMVQWSETPKLCAIEEVHQLPSPSPDLTAAWNRVERAPDEMLADVQNSGTAVDHELAEARLEVLYAAQQQTRGDLKNPTLDIAATEDTWSEMVNHTRSELMAGKPLPEAEGTPVDKLLKQSVATSMKWCHL
jgi:hypothetical protein